MSGTILVYSQLFQYGGGLSCGVIVTQPRNGSVYRFKVFIFHLLIISSAACMHIAQFCDLLNKFQSILIVSDFQYLIFCWETHLIVLNHKFKLYDAIITY